MRGISTACISLVVTCGACAPLPARDDPWYGHDKVQHFAYSAVIAAATTAYLRNTGSDDCTSAQTGIAFTFGLGISKEIYDASVRNVGWSWRDLVMDGAGAWVGALTASGCR